ncbi:MAG: hypothetical protein OEM83_03270 [Gammaproteobacteria bacterium]|nr:hypothetical protein [Gammaproteobacteria bacterium]MDH5511873.1 hypothetical protein [Gammaproteobacteria bacterium]
MKDVTLDNQNTITEEKTSGLVALIQAVPRLLVPMFALFFLSFALLYASSAIIEFVKPILIDGDFTSGLFKGLHMGVVALAVYELAQVVHQESDTSGKPSDIVRRIRRGVTRFGSVVFVALVLESLIMVIKYSQQDLAGFLYYPVAIIASASFLLISLGVFIKLSGSAALDDDQAAPENP